MKCSNKNNFYCGLLGCGTVQWENPFTTSMQGQTIKKYLPSVQRMTENHWYNMHTFVIKTVSQTLKQLNKLILQWKYMSWYPQNKIWLVISARTHAHTHIHTWLTLITLISQTLLWERCGREWKEATLSFGGWIWRKRLRISD